MSRAAYPLDGSAACFWPIRLALPRDSMRGRRRRFPTARRRGPGSERRGGGL